MFAVVYRVIVHDQHYDAVGRVSKIYGLNGISYKPGIYWSLDKSIHKHKADWLFYLLFSVVSYNDIFFLYLHDKQGKLSFYSHSLNLAQLLTIQK